MSDFQNFSLSGLNDSGIASPICANYNGPDVWFRVTAPSSGILFVASISGSLQDAAMAFYELPCSNPTELLCVPNDLCGNTEMPIYTFEGLTPGQDYLLRFWVESGPIGDFGLYVNENPIIVPDFILNGSATYISNECIRLTPNTTGQVGCIWFPDLIDFSQPFTHSMTINFGNQDANGADGITLAYQSVGTNFCGGTGGGIGAEGMANSFIVEFDTWQNTSRNDPVLDHTGVCINGNLNHAVAPFPPLVLGSGNVEDGQDHVIDFSWNPATQYFEVFFDGVQYYGETYDIVSNCFGSSPFAYWGYTASTGGSTNEQIVCPGVQTFDHGILSFQDVEICDNESFFAGGALQNTTGVYYDQIPLFDGCYELLQTNLTVQETFTTDLGSQYVCLGESFLIGDIEFYNPGSYDVPLNSIINGCDSTVSFTLNILSPIAQIWPPDTLDCGNPVVALSSAGSWPFNSPTITYEWTGPNGFTSNEANPVVNTAGEYSLTLIQTVNGTTCISNTEIVEVVSNDDLPHADAGNDGFIDCNIPSSILNGSNSDSGLMYEWTGPNGFYDTNLISSASDTGVYTLVVTAANDCSSSSQVEIIGDLTVPEITLELNDSLNCTTTSVSIVNSHYDSLQTAIWNGPEIDDLIITDSIIDVSQSGSYYVEIIGSNGCSNMDSIQVIEEENNVEYNLSADTITCQHTEAMILSSPGEFVTGIEWSGPNNFSDTTETIFADIPGTYFIQLEDDNGCIELDSIMVEIDTLTPYIDWVIDSIQCTENGFIQTTNTNTVSYNWSGPGNFMSQDSFVSSSISGTYTLEIEGENGCPKTFDIELNAVDDFPEFQLNFESLDCNTNSTEILLVPVDSISELIWTLPTGDLQMNESFESNLPGTYALEVTGISGCTVFDTIFINLDTLTPSLNLDLDTITCNTPKVTLGGMVNSNISSVLWSGPDGFSSEDISPQVESSGLYTVEITGENGCTNFEEVLITDKTETPLVELTSLDLTCVNTSGSVQATSQESLIWNWQGPDNYQSNLASINNLTAGIYTLDVQNEYGCDTTLIIEILADTLKPELILEDQILNCYNPSVSLFYESNSNIIQHTWIDPNGVESFNDQLSTAQSGTYSLTVEGQNGCTNSGVIEIFEDFEAPVNESYLIQEIDCNNSLGQLLGESADSTDSNVWKNGSDESLSSLLLFETDLAGLYIFESTGVNGCVNRDSIWMTIDTVAPNLQIDFNDINCYTPESFVEIVNPQLDLDYSFTQEDVELSTDPSIIISEAGPYTVSAQGSNGCISELEFMINIDTLSPTAPVELTRINCFNSEAHILTSLDTNENIEWSYGGLIVGSGSDIASSESGLYLGTLLNLENGCSQVLSAYIEPYEALVFDVDLIPTDCFKETGDVFFTEVSGGYGSYSYAISENGPFSLETDYFDLAPGQYSLIVTDEDGCSALTEVEIEEIIPVDILSDEFYLGQLGTELQILVESNISENDISTIEWTGDLNLDCVDCLDPIVMGYTDGIMNLFVVDKNGCEDQLEVQVRFIRDVDIYIPNVFTPHRLDGNNDFFFPFAKNNQIEQIDAMYLFDRWGEKVFQNFNFQPNDPESGWDGKFKEKNLQPGVFAYFIEYTRVDGEKISISGDVTIMD